MGHDCSIMACKQHEKPRRALVQSLSNLVQQASVISNIFSILLSLNASNTRGNTKKSIVNALFFVGYAVGAICGPLLWNTDNAPRYRSGLVLALVSWLVFIPTVLVYWYSCVYENKRRPAMETEANDIVVIGAEKELTDKQDVRFRYSY